MRNIWTIARREIRLYFNSPVAYIVGLLTLLISGIYFVLVIYLAGQSAYTEGSATAPGPDLVIGLMVFIFLFAIPALSMRLMADEHRNGTLELLLTAPIHEWELVIGKWLGSFLFILIIIAITFIYPIVLNSLVTPGIDQGLTLANYLAITLVAAAFLAIGTAISSFFNNQFAAFFATLAILFFLWLVIGWPSVVMQGSGGIFDYLSMSKHFASMQSGVIALSDIVYYLSLTALGLFLGTVAVEVRRWK
ncbi:MAG: ABC transporter permease [Anaerolineales bacterium]|jgi:ABC-2 type transport system permease protein